MLDAWGLENSLLPGNPGNREHGFPLRSASFTYTIRMYRLTSTDCVTNVMLEDVQYGF